MYNPNEPDPMFVMSCYANKADLYEAKAKFYMEKSDYLEARLRIADPDGETEDMVGGNYD